MWVMPNSSETLNMPLPQANSLNFSSGRSVCAIIGKCMCLQVTKASHRLCKLTCWSVWCIKSTILCCITNTEWQIVYGNDISTVCWTFHEMGFHCQEAAHKPKITCAKPSISWSSIKQATRLSQVLWSDELHLTIRQSDGRFWVWQNPGSICTRKTIMHVLPQTCYVHILLVIYTYHAHREKVPA